MSSLVSLLDNKIDGIGFAKYFIYAAIIVILAIVARKKRWLTPSGTAAACVSGFAILYINGFSSFIILLFFFLVGTMLSKVVRHEIKSEKKGSERDMMQVLANCLPALIALFIYKLTPYKTAALVAYAAAIAEALADTWAGDFGMLSDKDPLSIVTFTKVPKGISGGVTMLGFMGALFGSSLIALLYEGTFNPTFQSFFIITISGFLGSVLDSFLGATIQVHYRDKEGFLTEKDGDGEYERARGIPFVDNDMVNLLSGMFSMSLSFFIASLVF